MKSKSIVKKHTLSAVIRFFIGALLMIVVVGAAYILLGQHNFSSMLPDGVVVPVVKSAVTAQTTKTPPLTVTTPAPAASSAVSEDPLQAMETSPLTLPTNEPTPAPTPTPVPTPVPTPIPMELYSNTTTRVSMEKEGSSANLGLTEVYVSEVDENRVMLLRGWGYITGRNAKNSTVYLAITNKQSNTTRFYVTTQTPGATGVAHDADTGKNLDLADFQAVVNVGVYEDGDYSMGLILYNTDNDKNTRRYYPFASEYDFTVKDHAIVKP